MNRRKFLGGAALTAAWWQQRRAAQAMGLPGAQSGVVEHEHGVSPARLSADPLRPQFHLLPAANWMNDPCAPRFYAGMYHMFFQYNPHAAVWGDMHWAHATSPDMVHWKHQPVAIAPTPDGPDAYGIFTGSVFPGAEQPTVIYTGVTKVAMGSGPIRDSILNEVQMMAVAETPSLDQWTKVPEPVIAAHPEGLDVVGFRDPCPWREGDTWYMGVGSGFRSKGGAVLLYRSMDGKKWEYLHPLAQGKWNGTHHADPVDSGEMWECPDFFPLNDRHVLLYSSERKVYWQTGRLDPTTLRFRMRQQGMLDVGAFYAPKSMLDARGRRILWGWVPEKRPTQAYSRAGWAGTMALPRLLTVAPDGKLLMEPIGELSQLLRPLPNAGAEGATAADDAAAGKGQTGDGTRSGSWTLKQRQGRLRLQIRPGAGSLSMMLNTAAEAHDAEAMVAIAHDPAEAGAITVAGKQLMLRPDRNGVSTIDLWLDASVAEIFVDRYSVTTERFYGRPQEALRVVWSAGEGVVVKTELSEVRAISRDRLTT